MSVHSITGCNRAIAARDKACRRPVGIDAQIATVRASILRAEDILRRCPQAEPTREQLIAMRAVLATLGELKQVLAQSDCQSEHTAILRALKLAAQIPRAPEVWWEEGA